MGPERDNELGAAEPAEAKRQKAEKLRADARRLVGEARFLVGEAKQTVGQAAELLRARKERSWSFVSTCPAGHEGQQTDFDRATLAKRLSDGVEILLRCTACGRQWDATPEQRDRLRWAVRNRP